MNKAASKKRNRKTAKEEGQKIFVGSSIVHLSGFSLSNGKSGELDLTALNSKQIRKKIGWI